MTKSSAPASVFVDQSCEVSEELVRVEVSKRARLDHELTLTWGF